MHQRTSIPHRCHLQPTMLPFHCAEIHGQGYDSSKGLEVKASSGPLAATCRLYKSRLEFRGCLRGHRYRNSLRCSFFNSLTISCIDSTTQSDIVSDLRQPNKAIPRAREMPVADSFPSASGDMIIQQGANEERNKSNSHRP